MVMLKNYLTVTCQELDLSEYCVSQKRYNAYQGHWTPASIAAVI